MAVMCLQAWCSIREREKERSPSPRRRMCSWGWKGRVGWVCWVWGCGFDFGGFAPGLVGLETEAGRVTGFCFLEGLEDSLWRLFLPILRASGEGVCVEMSLRGLG